MAHVYTEESNFKNIANAIRKKNRTDNIYAPYEMAKAISEITPFLQEKEITITENGSKTIVPDIEYEGLSKVEVITELPIEKKEVLIYPSLDNNYIYPSKGYKAMENLIIRIPSKTKEIKLNTNGVHEIPLLDENIYVDTLLAEVNVGVVKLQEEETIYVNHNGVVSVLPDEGYDALKKVNVEVDIPLQEKNISIVDIETELIITPDEGYEGIKRVNVEVDIPIQETKNIILTDNGTVDITPDEGYDAIKKVNVGVVIPLQETKDITLTDNGTTTIIPDEGYTAIKKVNITSNILKGGIDFTKLGYTEEETENLNSGMDYALEIYANWDNSITDCRSFFKNDVNLIILPPLVTYKVTIARELFSNCTNLMTISPIDTSNVTDMYGMF